MGLRDINTTKFSESSLLIVGIVRDIEETIEVDLSRLDSAFSTFKRREYFLVESFSVDNSVKKLKHLTRRREDFNFCSMDADSTSTLSRTERMAEARNRYLDYLEKTSHKSQIDYVAIVDFNGLNRLINRNAIDSCELIQDWDVCTANQLGPYYDIWALRHKLWSPNDCWEHRNFLILLGVRPDKALNNAVLSKMIRISPKAMPIEVDSAFGGLALYKRDALSGVKYSGVDKTGGLVCEHVPLHAQIRNNNRKIIINPQMINFKYTDHSRSTKLMRRLLRWIKNIFLWQLRKKT